MHEPYIPDEVKRIAQQVAEGNRPEHTVRTVLSWYHYQRRSRFVVEMINRDLTHLKLGTVPHVDWTYLDGGVTFMPRDEAIKEDPLAYHSDVPIVEALRAPIPAEIETSVSHSGDLVVAIQEITPQLPFDPTYRLGRLEMSNNRPICIAPDATVCEAITIMLKHDYSQLPVTSGGRTIKGLFSWKSYGSRRSLGKNCTLVREAMDECLRVSVNDSIFHVVALIQGQDCVLVEDNAGVVTGIITPHDISVTFGALGEPFLVLGEIENHIRSLIQGRFTKDELTLARDPSDQNRSIDDPSDLTFGEYVRLLENPDRWTKLGVQLDRSTFIKDLEEVRRIRNEVMHFDPEGIADRELKSLRDFVSFLQRIRRALIG